MPKHYKGKTGEARKKALEEHIEEITKLDKNDVLSPEGIMSRKEQGYQIGGPVVNAMNRSVTYQAGGALKSALLSPMEITQKRAREKSLKPKKEGLFEKAHKERMKKTANVKKGGQRA